MKWRQKGVYLNEKQGLFLIGFKREAFMLKIKTKNADLTVI
jgi:hypothetical protein